MLSTMTSFTYKHDTAVLKNLTKYMVVFLTELLREHYYFLRLQWVFIRWQ